MHTQHTHTHTNTNTHHMQTTPHVNHTTHTCTTTQMHTTHTNAHHTHAHTRCMISPDLIGKRHQRYGDIADAIMDISLIYLRMLCRSKIVNLWCSRILLLETAFYTRLCYFDSWFFDTYQLNDKNCLTAPLLSSHFRFSLLEVLHYSQGDIVDFAILLLHRVWWMTFGANHGARGTTLESTSLYCQLMHILAFIFVWSLQNQCFCAAEMIICTCILRSVQKIHLPQEAIQTFAPSTSSSFSSSLGRHLEGWQWLCLILDRRCGTGLTITVLLDRQTDRQTDRHW